MAGNDIENVNIDDQQVLITPAALKEEMPLSDAARRTVLEGRQTINNILDGKDPRLFLVVGPCSIHDPEAAMDYARRLKALADEVSDTLYLVMRVYFEKPRTTTGWKGLINDPHLDDSFDIEKASTSAAACFWTSPSSGLPTATEALDPISPQYLQDTISWSAIGARTTESQTHREMSSNLSMAIGFKNGTDGALDVAAVNAMKSTGSPHSFLGLDQQGKVAITRTRGNPYSHVVLRGGGSGPNYDSVNVALCEKSSGEAGVRNAIMVDCSHANSNKDPAVQPWSCRTSRTSSARVIPRSLA